MTEEMKQVSREKFFERLRVELRDVHPRIINDIYPYTCVWFYQKVAGQAAFGKTVGRVERGVAITDYFLTGSP